jgi:hypothetical protein
LTAIPSPRFDHVVVNVDDQLDTAAATYERLGFQLTERGHHTLGSSNNLAIFGTDYLELLGYEPARLKPGATLWDMPKGLGGLVFKPGPDAGFRDAIVERGVPASESKEFSRPVDLPEGPQDAKFRVTHLAAEVAFGGRVFFCHHFTPELVWRSQWQTHPNGVMGIAEFVVVSSDPGRAMAPYRALFGDEYVSEVEGGMVLTAGKGRLLVLNPGAVTAYLGDALPPLPADGADKMVGLVLRTSSLAKARTALEAGSVPVRAEIGRLLVDAADACGLAMGFIE